jgi:hypothetical protein
MLEFLKDMLIKTPIINIFTLILCTKFFVQRYAKIFQKNHKLTDDQLLEVLKKCDISEDDIVYFLEINRKKKS